MKHGRLLALPVLAFLLAPTGCGGGRDVPEEVVRRNVTGTSMLSQQKWAEAVAAFREALERRPDDPVLLVNEAVALLQQGEVDAAEESLRKALAAAPDDPYANYDMGLIEKNRGAFDAALAHFEKVAAHDPDDVATQYNLATVLARLDRVPDAERAFRRALEGNPNHISSLYGLGRLLLQKGDRSEGTRLVELSQEIRARSGLDEAIGTQYGEQGLYAMGVDYPAGALPAPAPVAVKLRAGARVETGTDPLPAWTIAPLPGVERPVLVVADGGGVRGLRSGGEPIPTAPPPPGGAAVRALAAGDVDGDGVVEIAAVCAAPGADRSPSVRLLRAQPGGSLAWDGEPAVGEGDAPAAERAAVVFVDVDHDGDLDLFWCWSSGEASACRIARNDGAGGFEQRPEDHGVALGPAPASALELSFSDADNDRDVDLLVLDGAGLHLFANQRDGSFADVSDRSGLGASVRGAIGFRVADLDKDGWMDVVVAGADGARVLTNRRGKFTAPRSVGAAASGGAGKPAGVVVLDYDNDGFLDVAASAGGRMAVHRNLGAGQWGEGPPDLLGETDAAVPLAAFDADGDGDLDLAASAPGSIVLLRNEGGNANHWTAVRPQGVRDNRHGIGAKVEVLAGLLRQKFEVTGPLALHAGLASRTEVDSVRIVWPGGVLQDELRLQAGRDLEVKQLDRKGTSCPLLYAWRDGRFRFVTDFLGGCAIGYQHAPGVFSVPDTDEYVKIEGALTSEDGRLRLRLNNQLEEVIFFDLAELVIVDHPEGTEVFPNERLMPGPPFPEFRLFASADLRPIASAREVEGGRDVTDLLAAADRRWPDGFRKLAFKGYAELHTLEIDLGASARGRRLVLLLDGWIDYADSSSNVAASQAGAELLPPEIEVPDGAGGWRAVPGLMGFPAGLPKTMAVELTGVFPATDPRIRIRTSMRIYWDRARVMVGGEGTPLRVSRLRPSRAELRFGGFPAETSPDSRAPFDYDPDVVSPTAPWKAHAGPYTAFGEVSDLLSRVDDRFVITRGGDEIELEFDDPGPVAPGWTRTYLLHSDGFGKDMDLNSAAADEVGPLPFHGMPGYPYAPGITPPVGADFGGRPPRIVREAAPAVARDP